MRAVQRMLKRQGKRLCTDVSQVRMMQANNPVCTVKNREYIFYNQEKCVMNWYFFAKNI
jgi:hypothetical protein